MRATTKKAAVFVGSVALAVSTVAVAIDTTAASASTHRMALGSMQLSASDRSHPLGAVPRTAPVRFDLMLSIRHQAQLAATVRAVSRPESAQYRHYLTMAQFDARFAPTTGQIATAKRWLRREHIAVTAMPRDRLFIEARGTATSVEKAFGTGLAYYLVKGKRTQLTTRTATIPTGLTSIVTGATGLNQVFAKPDLTSIAKTVRPADAEPGPPSGFRNPQPCSAYWGQKLALVHLPKPYNNEVLPYDICGYTPAQLRGGYGLSASSSNNGSGVTIAIVDAYDSPTLLSDAQEYASLNDAAHPLATSQFTDINPGAVDLADECGGSGWYDEQSLDVEASHAMAPGAHINFVGATDCTDQGLLNADTTAIASGASVVSNSWGDGLGDLFTDDATKTAFDNEFAVAATTGVSVLFSSGDAGDNFADTGLAVPDYPESSPYVTSVGGTSLEVGRFNNRIAEYGWSTAKSTLSSSGWSPIAFQAGGGGGSSYYYGEPSYQGPIVPAPLADRNAPLFGVATRVVPDIAMDADAQTGMLIGLTQTFPDGTYYAQFKEGGTSLASPLLAGVIADADQVAGTSIGFLNPALYYADGTTPAAFNDIVPPVHPDEAAVVRVDYTDGVDSASGYTTSLRVLDYEGPETYCDGAGNCATRPVTLTTAPGFDGVTGMGTINGQTFLTDLAAL